MKTITPMRAWMAAATTDEQMTLALRVRTTRGQLYQLAGGHRQASADMAGRVESVTAEMHKASRGRLPLVFKTDLCAACRACQYASKCLGSRAVVSDFPIVSEVSGD
jgi:hypothetical protein